jgi:UDP-glucose:(heptosyl)LPS alpha-1,3-glucosyltransferase
VDRIAIIRSTYTPFGGVERVTLNLIKGLLAKGMRVDLLTMPGQKWPVDNARLTIKILGISHGHRLLTTWAFNRGVTRYLGVKNYDVILSLDKVALFTHLHAGGGSHKAFLRIKNRSSTPLSRFFRKFSLFHRHTLYLEHKGFHNPLLKKVRCNSRLVKKDIQADYGVPAEKLVVIPSDIRWRAMTDVYANKNAVAAKLQAKHQIHPNWNCLLFLGSGFSRKGLDIAIRGLKQTPPNYHLLVVGKGSTSEYLKLAAALGIRQRVHFLGPQPEGWRYASLCKALVLPSRYDPFGGAAAEAHAMGIPVLISDKTGYMDYIIPDQNGVVCALSAGEAAVAKVFQELVHLIDHPVWSPDQLRAQARQLDETEVLNLLLTQFLDVQ